MDCMMGGNCMGGMMWLMWIFWIVVAALIVWGVYRFTRGRGSGGQANQEPTERATPMETLQQRYAAGEINTEEYEERKRTLGE